VRLVCFFQDCSGGFLVGFFLALIKGVTSLSFVFGGKGGLAFRAFFSPKQGMIILK
jgi:hypothetical protein